LLRPRCGYRGAHVNDAAHRPDDGQFGRLPSIEVTSVGAIRASQFG
jgi:hypothetical protein